MTESRSSRQYAGLKRLALISFGVLFLTFFIAFALVEGIGDPSIPDGDIVLVEGVPSDIGTVSEEEFDRAFLQWATQAGLKEAPKPGEDKYEEVRNVAISELINAIWTKGQAEAMGIELDQQQLIDDTLDNIKDENFKAKGSFERALKESHTNLEDAETQVRLPILRYQIERRREAQGESQVEFQNDYTSKWTARTFCADDYLNLRCANYVGSGHPSAALPACYEEDPSEPPEACPAPVTQTQPALPGSTSVLIPQGQRLPQRPRPEGLEEADEEGTGVK